jgi:hypothetical protein
MRPCVRILVMTKTASSPYIDTYLTPESATRLFSDNVFATQGRAGHSSQRRRCADRRGAQIGDKVDLPSSTAGYLSPDAYPLQFRIREIINLAKTSR